MLPAEENSQREDKGCPVDSDKMVLLTPRKGSFIGCGRENLHNRGGAEMGG